MISDPDNAKQVIDTMNDIGDRLQASMAIAVEKCSQEEFQAYKKTVGRLFFAILEEVLEPVYDSNPSLKPAGWDNLDSLSAGWPAQNRIFR
jgi:hypothetical protein